VTNAGVTYMPSHNQLCHPCLTAAREVLELILKAQSDGRGD